MEVNGLHDQSLRNDDAAKVMGIAPGTLSNMRSRGEGPFFFRIGRSVRYRHSDVLKFINKCTIDPEGKR